MKQEDLSPEEAAKVSAWWSQAFVALSGQEA